MEKPLKKSIRYLLKTCTVFVTILTISSTTFGQGYLKDTIINCKLLIPAYSFQEPAADMAKSFSWDNAIGASFYFKFGHNLMLGVDFNYYFGNNIKDDSLFRYISTSQGGILGTDGVYSNVALYERGYNITARVGKIFRIFHSNHNSGLMVLAGAGFIQHKIRIVVINTDIPELTGDYLKGYDQLTNGPCLSQYIGYQHLGKNKLGNYNIGLELFEGFTQNRRVYNFDSMGPDNSLHLDMLIGIKIGAVLPFYRDVSRIIYTH